MKQKSCSSSTSEVSCAGQRQRIITWGKLWGATGGFEPKQNATLIRVPKDVRIVRIFSSWTTVIGKGSDGRIYSLSGSSPLNFFGPLTFAIVRRVAVGEKHTLVLTEEGSLFGWGLNDVGQLGLGASSAKIVHDPLHLVCMVAHGPVRDVAVGDRNSLACTSKGEVFAWGDGSLGQLGIGFDTIVHQTKNEVACHYDSFVELQRSIPTRVKHLRNIVAVACGWKHCAVVCSEGKVYTFGWGLYGALGSGSSSNAYLPGRVLFDELSGSARLRCVSIALGMWHSLAVCRETSADGRHTNCVYAWGHSQFGQLGLDREAGATFTIFPRRIKSLSGLGVFRVSCGSRHSAAITLTGKIYAWGMRWFDGGDVCSSQWSIERAQGELSSDKACATHEERTGPSRTPDRDEACDCVPRVLYEPSHSPSSKYHAVDVSCGRWATSVLLTRARTN